MTIIECIDHDAFSGDQEDTADVAMLVALATTREQLGDFIHHTESDLSTNIGKTAAPHLDSPVEPSRVTISVVPLNSFETPAPASYR